MNVSIMIAVLILLELITVTVQYLMTNLVLMDYIVIVSINILTI